MDTLLVIGQRLIEYADKNHIPLEGRESLEFLVVRAQRLLEEIVNPIQDTWKKVNRTVTSDIQLFGCLRFSTTSLIQSKQLRML